MNIYEAEKQILKANNSEQIDNILKKITRQDMENIIKMLVMRINNITTI